MKIIRPVSAIGAATIWIIISEFVRNEFLLKSFWVSHYRGLGLVFPSGPVNGAIWGVWSVIFSIVIYFLMGKFSLIQTTLIAWITGFVLMWLVIGNLNVLPFGILAYSVPLSILEAFVAAWIIKKMI
jgi:hypothetical protein